MIEIKDLRKSYKTGTFVNKALDGVTISFRDNEFVAVLGPSGSGKTTLLNVLGGLDHADSGDIVINGVSTKNYRSGDWDTYRNHRIGFIFQSYNLIPHQTVLANVELALTLANVRHSERVRRSKEMLVKVGLGDHMDKKPNQLSGGQMQRVAIARALVNDPDIVLADEPTGALDTETGIQVMDLLSEVAKDRLVIMVTHNPELAQTYATRIVSFHDGRVVGDTDPIRSSEQDALLGAIPLVGPKHAKPSPAPVAAPLQVPPAQAAHGVRGAHAAPAAPAAQTAPAAQAAPVSREGFAARRADDKKKKASMGFLTALALSFNNLMTKKGRTFLTAFAGSIGIIGIAAILALSNGVNAYIAETEEDALTAYPLTITKSSFDIANLMTGMMGYAQTDEESQGSGPNRSIPQSTIMTDMFAKVKNNDLRAFKSFLDEGGDGIYQYVNDIEYSYGIDPLVYKTDTSDGPVKLNPSYMKGVFSNGLNTSSLMSTGSGMTSFQQMLEDEDLMRSQIEVVEGRWPEKYDEVALVLSKRGKISDYTLYSLGVLDPKKMEEMTKQALNGEDVEVPDDHVDFTYDDAMNLTFAVVPTAWTYRHNDDQDTWTDMSKDDDYMVDRIHEGIQLKVVGVLKSHEDATSTLLSEGIAYTPALTRELMRLADESDIVQQQKDDDKVDVFTGKTFEELQDDQGNDFDFGSVFSVDEDALRNAFSFDASALKGMGKLDMSGMEMDPSSLNIDPSTINVDPSAMESAFSEDTIKELMKNAPPYEFKLPSSSNSDGSGEEGAGEGDGDGGDANGDGDGGDANGDGDADDDGDGDANGDGGDGDADGEGDGDADGDGEGDGEGDEGDAVGDGDGDAAGDGDGDEGGENPEAGDNSEDTPSFLPITITDEEREQIEEAANSLSAGFFAYLATEHPEELAKIAAGEQVDVAPLFQEYLDSDEQAAETLQGISDIISTEFQTQMTELVQNSMEDYMVNQFAPYLSVSLQQIMAGAAQAMATSMAQSMAEQMAAATGQMGSALSKTIGEQLGGQFKNISKALQKGFKVDANAFANAMHFNMTQDDLTSLLMNYMNADELTYDGNLKKLGYASEDNPESISIYSKDFAAKEQVLDIIDGYNDRVSTGDDDSETIQYSDIAGVLMSSVTDIVDMISLVLIAFVSISLVVSSIMIAIVTYISVLERKKEIGVLRAMGASRGNIANVFNAETVIEGFISGVLAIAVVLLVSVPVNQIVLDTQGVANVMQLPWDAALILIGISVVLTFIAGLIPSQKAAHADPVEALRSE